MSKRVLAGARGNDSRLTADSCAWQGLLSMDLKIFGIMQARRTVEAEEENAEMLNGFSIFFVQPWSERMMKQVKARFFR